MYDYTGPELDKTVMSRYDATRVGKATIGDIPVELMTDVLDYLEPVARLAAGASVPKWGAIVKYSFKNRNELADMMVNHKDIRDILVWLIEIEDLCLYRAISDRDMNRAIPQRFPPAHVPSETFNHKDYAMGFARMYKQGLPIWRGDPTLAHHYPKIQRRFDNGRYVYGRHPRLGTYNERYVYVRP
jgi:hypothetical protein